MKILLVKTQSQHGVFSVFIDCLDKAFQELGCETKTFIWDDNNILDFYQVINEGWHFILSFNGGILGLQYQEQSLFDYVNILYMPIFVDHPLHQMLRIEENVKNTVFIWLDKEHAKFVNRFYNGKQNAFAPLAGEPPKEGEDVLKTERDIDVLFSGTYMQTNIMETVKEKLPQSIYKLLNDVTDYKLAHYEKTLEESYQYVLEDKGIYLDDENLFKFIKLAGSEFDIYIRSLKRYQILKKLAQDGIDITCYGNGWDKTDLTGFKNFTHKGAADFLEILEITKKAKLFLNVMPLFTKGSHERIFYAMLHGSVCVVDKNIYLEEQFKHLENIIFYTYDDLDDLTGSIHKVLSNPVMRKEIAAHAYQSTIKNHTWKNRAEDILKIYESYSLFKVIGS